MFYQSAGRHFVLAGKGITLCAAGCLMLSCLAVGSRAATVYTWNGTTDSTFTTATNWAGGLVATTGGTFNARISVQNGAANQLIYTAAQGTTIYNSDQRALFIGSVGNGAMTISGGTFESQATTNDGMANAGIGSLTINGGSYINTNGAGTKTFEVVFGGAGTGTLNIQSGAFSVGTLQFGDVAASTGTGTVNLTGGTLTVQTITDSGTAVSNFNFNGGTLKALGAAATMNAMDAATVQSGGAVVDTNGVTMTIAASLLNGGGGGGLTKNNTGTLILTGANAYTGTTLINTGTLQIGAGAAAGTLGTGGVTNNGTLTFNRSDAITVSNAISGSGNVVQAGGGTTTLSAANTYGGSTTVSGGTLALGVNNALPSTTGLSLTGGTFSGGGFSNTLASLTMTGGGAFNSGAGAITVTGATTITNGIFNVNSGGGSVTTNSLSLGPGTVNIGNSSATTQTLTIGAGGLSLTGSSVSIGNAAGVAGATAKLALNGNVTSSGTSSFSTAATTGTVLVDLGGGTRDFNVTGGTFTAGVPIQNGNLSKSGAGAMVLTETNTYANTTISGGSLTIGNGGTTGTLGTGSVTNNGALSFNRTDTITVNNVISGTGSVSQIGAGGTLILGGANSYDGLTSVSNTSVLRATSATALGSAVGGTTVAAGSRVELAGGTTVAGESITINGNGTNNFGALQSQSGNNTWSGPVVLGDATARVGARTGLTLTLSGSISDGGGSNLLVSGENGTGKVVISGGTKTYSGATNIVRGILQLGASNVLPSGTTLDVDTANAAETATFDLNGFNQTVAILQRTDAGGGAGDSIVTNSAAGASTLTINNSAGSIFNGKFTNTGTLNVTKTSGGNLQLGGDNSGWTSGTFTVNGGQVNLNAANSGSAGVALNLTAAGVTLLTNDDVAGIGQTISYGSLSGVAGSTLRNGGNTAGTNTYSIGALNTNTQFDGNITDGVVGGVLTALTKVGTGTLTLTANNTYSGVTNVSNGVLNIQNSGALGNATGGTLLATGATNATIELQNNITINDALTVGNVAVTGTLRNISGNNTWAGNITKSGVLTLQSDTGNLLVSGNIGGTGNSINLTGASTGEVSGIISTAFQINKSGAGSWKLSNGGNSYPSLTNVTAGTLEVTANGALGTTATGTTVANNARLLLTNTLYTTTEPLTITGNGIGGLNGALHATGTSRFDGNITVPNGQSATIFAPGGASLTLGTGTTTISKDNATLIFNGGGTFTVNAQITGPTNHTSDLNVSGGSTVILTNVNNNFMGPLNIINGTLKLGATEVVPNGSEVTFGTATTGSVFDMANGGSNFNETIRGLSSTVASGGVARNSQVGTNSILTLAPQGSETWIFSGNIEKNPGTINLVLNGSTTGTQRLSGTNDVSGLAVATNGGTLAVTGGTTQVTGTGGITPTPSGANFLPANNVAPQAGATLDVNSSGHLIVNSGGAFTLSGGLLDFRDYAAGGATNHKPADAQRSMIQVNSGGAFNFTGGTLRDVSVIGLPAVGGGTLTQNGSTTRFVIGQDMIGPGATTTINGNYNLVSGVLAFDIFGAPVAPEDAYSILDPNDRLDVHGTVTLAGTLEINFIAPFNPLFHQDWNVITSDSPIVLQPGFAVNGAFYRIVPIGGGGNGQALQVYVPEPGTIAVWSLVGLVGGGWFARRRRRA